MRLGRDWLPLLEAAFVAWLNNFLAVLHPRMQTFDVDQGTYTSLGTRHTQLVDALQEIESLKAQLKSKVVAKNALFHGLRSDIRTLVRRLQSHPAMTDEVRALLGIPIRDTNPSVGNAPVVYEDRPNLLLVPDLYRVVVHFGPKPGASRGNKLPPWAAACRIYRKKQGDADFVMVGFASKSPFVDSGIRGQAAEYIYQACYQEKNTTTVGPMSQPTIVAALGEEAA